jgi:hypothetical protein
LGILDLEPNSLEIREACSNRYGDRYMKLRWGATLLNTNDPNVVDMEHAAEMELIQKKRLHAEINDAITVV